MGGLQGALETGSEVWGARRSKLQSEIKSSREDKQTLEGKLAAAEDSEQEAFKVSIQDAEGQLRSLSDAARQGEWHALSGCMSMVHQNMVGGAYCLFASDSGASQWLKDKAAQEKAIEDAKEHVTKLQSKITQIESSSP